MAGSIKRAIVLLVTAVFFAATSLACDDPEPEEELPEETIASAGPTDEATDKVTVTPSASESPEPSEQAKATPSETAAPAPVVSGGPDAPGAKDFREVGRFPNSYIERWASYGEVTDCQGVGPVAAYERLEVQYQLPAEHIRPARDILNHLLPGLLERGWLVRRSDPFSFLLYRGADPGSLHYTECNPAGQTEWIYIGVNSDTSGHYTVQMVVPEGTDPF